MRAYFTNPLRKLREIWILAKNERDSPREIGLAVALGVFIGCSPAVGFHGGLAIACATVLRLSRLWAWLGSRSSAMVILPFIAYAEVEVAHVLRTGSPVTLEREHLLDAAKGLLLDWTLGMFPVGGVLAAVLGFLAYLIAKRRSASRKSEI